MRRYRCPECGMIWGGVGIVEDDNRCLNCDSASIEICKEELMKYKHNGTDRSVRRCLKGLHREFDLCFICEFFDVTGEEIKCPIKMKISKICAEDNIIAPIWECAKFKIL